MVRHAWIGLAALAACNLDATGIGQSGSGTPSSGSSGTTTATDASTSTGQPPATSMGSSGTDLTTGSETAALDSSTSTPGESSSSGEPACDATPPWWDIAWSRRRPVTVDGSSVAEDLMSVPIRLRLDDTRIDHAAVQDGGADLRFIDDATGTELAYEVEHWDDAGSSEIWLRIPTLPAGGTATVWMYHDNAAAPPGDDPPGVWDDDFVSVHHLADLSDATDGGHEGFGANLPADAEGRIGRGLAFDGNDDQLELPDEGDFDFDVALTVEVWALVSSFTVSWQALVTKGDHAWRLHRENNTSFIGFGSDASSGNDNLSGTTPVADGQWHHLVIVYGDGVKRIYVDGQSDASDDYPGPLNLTNAPVRFGNNADTGPRFFHGTLDEVRISRVARVDRAAGPRHGGRRGRERGRRTDLPVSARPRPRRHAGTATAGTSSWAARSSTTAPGLARPSRP